MKTMKATINGITVEGTPQELADYQVIMDQLRRNDIHIKPPLGKPLTSAMDAIRKMADQKIQGGCGNGACFCTGDCTSTLNLHDRNKEVLGYRV